MLQRKALEEKATFLDGVSHTQNFQLIFEGPHELTAKISCPDGGTEWHSINVSGVATGNSLPSENDPFERPVYEHEDDFDSKSVANRNDNYDLDHMPPLNEGERCVECEERSGGLVCDIIKADNKGGGRSDCSDEGYEDGQNIHSIRICMMNVADPIIMDL
jgi:hypothetical protein